MLTLAQWSNHSTTTQQTHSKGYVPCPKETGTTGENLSQRNAQPSLKPLQPPATDNQPPDSIISKPIQQLLLHYPRQYISKQVRQVQRHWLFCQPHGALYNRFATSMIWDAVMFLLQYRLWSQKTFNWLIFAKPVSFAFNWDPKHTKSLSQCFNRFNCILKCS